jgi:hypothetical protein
MSAVTRAAVLGRINRKLAHDGETMRTSRSERDRFDPGTHYIESANDFVYHKHVDLEALARELGVLCDTETVLP